MSGADYGEFGTQYEYSIPQDQKILQQLGYLKSMLDSMASSDRVKALEVLFQNTVTDKDLEILWGKVQKLILEKDGVRERRLVVAMEKAFERATPGTINLVDARMKAMRQVWDDENLARLKKKGLKLDEAGEVVYIVNPAVRFAKRYSIPILVGVVITAAFNPGLAGSLVSAMLRLVFR